MNGFLEQLEPKEAQNIIRCLRQSALKAEKTETYLEVDVDGNLHSPGFLNASWFLRSIRRDAWRAVYAEHVDPEDGRHCTIDMLCVLPNPNGAVQFLADLVMWTERLFDLVDTIEVDGNIWIVFLF